MGHRNVTKADLIHDISLSTGFKKEEIKTVVESFFDVVADDLNTGNAIELRGFGTLKVKMRKSRPARNIITGDVVMLPEHPAVVCKFAPNIKKSVNRGF